MGQGNEGDIRYTSVSGYEMQIDRGEIAIPSGTSVTAHPPPPAPVSFVVRPYGDAVFSLIVSSEG